YEVTFARGSAEIRIGLTPNGKLLGATIRADGDGTPGTVVDCSQEPTLKPTTSTAPIAITFLNRRDADVRPFGIAFDGKRMTYGTVGAERSSPPIWVTVAQPIVVADLSDNCLEIVVAGTTTQTTAITSARPGEPQGASSAVQTQGGVQALRELIESIRRG